MKVSRDNPKAWAILILLVIGLLVVLSLCCRTEDKSIPSEKVQSKEVQVDTIPDFFGLSPEEGLYKALEYYNIYHKDIVYAQAVLETGWFKSDICLNNNNLFGLYNSKEKCYYTFNHWAESVEAYAKYVQYKYKAPSDYYSFLRQIKYATDEGYTRQLKIIVKQIQNDKRRHTKGDSGS